MGSGGGRAARAWEVVRTGASQVTRALRSAQQARAPPLHAHFELSGAAAAQVGVQEKTAFVVQGKKLSGGQLYQPIVSIPATIELLLVRIFCFTACTHVLHSIKHTSLQPPLPCASGLAA